MMKVASDLARAKIGLLMLVVNLLLLDLGDAATSSKWPVFV